MLGFLIGWIILILVITIHEAAHAWMADRLGDPTAKLAGRLSLNPAVHIDPLGTVILPLLMYFSGIPLLIGWAKPTPFDPFNLRNPKVDSAKIAFAGPASNLLIAFIFAVILRLPLPGILGTLVSSLGISVIKISVFLAIFNLIPISPLDGFKVVGGFLSKDNYHSWLELERYGVIILFLLLFPIFGGNSPLFSLINPIVNFLLSFLIPGMGLSGGVI